MCACSQRVEASASASRLGVARVRIAARALPECAWRTLAAQDARCEVAWRQWSLDLRSVDLLETNSPPEALCECPVELDRAPTPASVSPIAWSRRFNAANARSPQPIDDFASLVSGPRCKSSRHRLIDPRVDESTPDLVAAAKIVRSGKHAPSVCCMRTLIPLRLLLRLSSRSSLHSRSRRSSCPALSRSSCALRSLCSPWLPWPRPPLPTTTSTRPISSGSVVALSSSGLVRRPAHRRRPAPRSSSCVRSRVVSAV